MAIRDILMRRKNGQGLWDVLFPITTSKNVQFEDGSDLDQRISEFDTVIQNLNAGAGATVLIDHLNSIRKDAALSANQGRALKELIGDLSTLQVQDRSTLVAAINEILTYEQDRNAAESRRNQLYEDLLDLREIIGTEPEGNLAESILDIQKAGRSLSHSTGGLKDLVEDNGVLYRLQPSIESDSAWIRHVQVGRTLLNSGMELTVPGTETKVRLYMKAIGERDGYVTVHADGLEANNYVLPINNYTRQYSMEITVPADRKVKISTLTAWGQEVKIWDFDWRVDV